MRWYMLKCISILIHGVYSLFQRFKMKKSLVSVNATRFPSRAMTVRDENLTPYSKHHTKPFCLKTPDIISSLGKVLRSLTSFLAYLKLMPQNMY